MLQLYRAGTFDRDRAEVWGIVVLAAGPLAGALVMVFGAWRILRTR